MNVDMRLAKEVADGLGITDLPEPLPKVLQKKVKPEVTQSKTLSLLARPGSEGIKTRRIAILVADGVDGKAAVEIHSLLMAQGGVPRFVGTKLGHVQSESSQGLVEVEVSMEAMPSVLWDGMIVPDGRKATEALSQSGHAMEFLKDQYRHCKAILLLGTAEDLLARAGILTDLGSHGRDSGLLRYEADVTAEAVDAFIKALARHRHFARETDPPRI